jgi:hypothetical protein
MKNLHAILIDPSGRVDFIDIPNRLESIIEAVGSWVEVLEPTDVKTTWRAYCDEEGWIKQLPENPLATLLVRKLGWNNPARLVGPVLFLGVDNDGNDCGVTLSTKYVLDELLASI